MSSHRGSAAATARGRLQEGIYFGSGKRPGRAYRLLLLDIERSTSPAGARAAIAAVWAMLLDLRAGVVRDLRRSRDDDPKITVEPGDLTCLLGFGAPFFEHQPTLTPDHAKPVEPSRLGPSGVQPFPSLPWARQDLRTGEADLAIQLIAETELAVNRAVVEVYSLIDEERLPLRFLTFHGGFNRDDARSWLGFHDGISNINRDERRLAIEVTTEPSWMEGGTYMAFLRLALDLHDWRTLSREEQEILVGRHKLTGCPLHQVEAGPLPRVTAGCPFTGTPPGSSGHFEPERRPADRRLDVSHIYRTNPTREGPAAAGTNRIFRQGYEFVETLAEGQLRLGLNFVSFQRDLAHVKTILTRPGWMESVNFGGRYERGARAPVDFVSVIAGGYYAVPPDDRPFPGSQIFGSK